MKKIFFAVAAIALTACVSNEDLEPVGNYGRISVNLSNEAIVETRAAVTDLSEWTIKAKNTATQTEANLANGTATVPAGTYEVAASNYADEAAWMAANEGRGDAYYTGTKQASVTAGTTAEVSIDCSKAKNARLKVTFPNGNELTECTLSAKQDNRTIEYSTSENSAGYFKAETVSYTLTYKYNNSDKTTQPKPLTLAAGTETTITVSLNTNGILSVDVSTEEFTEGTTESITIDAATGEVVTE